MKHTNLKFSLVLCLLFSINAISQIDSLKVGDKYWEDQLFFAITYDITTDKLQNETSNGFSYSFSAGYIKDIPITKSGNMSFGVGAGYSFNSLNNLLQVTDTNTLQIPNNISANKIKLHDLIIPLQFRWRTSDAVTYSFWRIYTGIRFTYNLSNKFTYRENDNLIEFNNINVFNNFQTGLELSAGYGAFNFFIYHGLSSIFKDTSINNKEVNTTITKFGLIFYLL